MKKEKESLAFKIFWFIITASPIFGLVSILLLPLKLDWYLHLVISLFFSLFYAKNIIDKTDLENQIFELKELIENLKK